MEFVIILMILLVANLVFSDDTDESDDYKPKPLVICPVCQSPIIVIGDIITIEEGIRSSPKFIPDDINYFIRQKSVSFLKKNTFKACVQCGYLWNTLNVKELHNLIENKGAESLKQAIKNNSIPQENNQNSSVYYQQAQLMSCHLCESLVIVSGCMEATDFFPKGLIKQKNKLSVRLLKKQTFQACTQCGHVWGNLDETVLYNLLLSKGIHPLRQWINDSIIFECDIPMKRDIASIKLNHRTINFHDKYYNKNYIVVPTVMAIIMFIIFYLYDFLVSY